MASEQDRDDDEMRVGRRRALQGAGAVLGVSAVGCASDDGEGGDDGGDGSSTGGSDDGVGTGSGSGSSSGDDGDGGSTAADGTDGGSGDGSTGEVVGSECGDAGGLSPEELLAPIEHVIVVMMENRTFDHFFGARQLVEGLEVDGLSGRESNPDARGNPIEVFHSENWTVPFDPPHSWSGSRVQWNEGANDGFVLAYEEDGAPDPSAVMGYHVREQLPVLWALADNYVLCERWFASVMGPTWPNRFYLHLATSGGQMGNDPVSDIPSIFDRLDDAGLSNVYYNSSLPFTLTYGKTTGTALISEFFEAAEAGTLPTFCMVEPTFTAALDIGNDDHPPADIRMGQAFLASVYNALAASPQWDRCLLVITYDEHGGFYDHVPPPETFDERPEFRQLGFRVPAVIVGPHVRRGCVSSVQMDHVTVAATVTRRFGLEPLNERVTMTNDVSSAIDPAFVAAPQPPVALPPVEVVVPPKFRASKAVGGQIELATLARGRGVVADDGGQAHEHAMRSWLAWAERLGAVKIVG